MRSALLLGRDHVEQGRIACVGEASLAIAISRGGAKKTYAYKEPNEDAACFAHGDAGHVVAVADGHAGAEASEFAVRTLLDEAAPAWTDHAIERGSWPTLAEELVLRVHSGIVRAGIERRSEARTTFSIACIQPEAGFCAWIAAGDSHIFAIGAAPQECGAYDGPTRFLGSTRADAAELGLRVGSCDLAGLRAIVLATDGLSERGIGVADPLDAAARALAAASSQTGGRQPLAAARGLAETAIAAHKRQQAGDNIATAVCWLGDL